MGVTQAVIRSRGLRRGFKKQPNNPMKNKSVIISSVCVALAFCLPLSVSAKEKKTEASPAATASPSETAAASTKAQGFRGTITTVDQSAKTFTLSGKMARVIKVTDKTEITKDGNPATMSDIAENEKVSGSYWKHADGTLEGKKVTLGAKAEKTKKESKKEKEEASPSPAASP
jgi:predicted HNH restriction endonuclease